MPIDPLKINSIYHQLREMVGEQGSFVLLAVKPEGDYGETTEMRTSGPPLRTLALIDAGIPITRELVKKRFLKTIKEKPAEPD